MARGFIDYQPGLLPPWLADEQGIAFEKAFGKTKDDGLDSLRQATKARWPDANRPDALPYQAHDRLLLRAPPETDAQHAARLLTAPDIWQWGGTPTAIYNVFAPYWYSTANMVVVPNHAVILEGNLTWFSRSILLLSAGYFAVDTPWDNNPADQWPSEPTTQTWDSTALTSDLSYMRASIRTMKSDEAYPVLIGVQLTGAPGDGLWDQLPVDVWDAPGALWDAGAGPAILWPLGHVWEEENFIGAPTPPWAGTVAQAIAMGETWDDFVPPDGGWGFLTP